MTTTSDHDTAWYTLDPDQVVRALSSDAADGLSAGGAARELERRGPNVIPTEPKASRWQIVLRIWADPMSVMLTIVAAVAFVFGQAETGWLVIVLVLLNLFMGANQEIKAQASADALASLQVPEANVIRGGVREAVPAADLVP